ncbi:unnamed protein product [Phaedon cochleariae]|uniref:Uncharacterized protein n=1 Tax=Phaedon cochleariae TaxID=80249 RepID=A0A9P0DUK4_PHACE|nr:unnamed protein product [Phaedon cochleariae]
MKFLVVLATVILTVNALTDSGEWAAFKEKHGKTYKSALEESVRYSIFQNNLRKIEDHNARYDSGEETYYLGTTIFADMSTEEFKAMLKRQMKKRPALDDALKHEYDPENKLPESVDWRKEGAVTPVQNQGHCGSCWAFSATGSLEGQHAIKNNVTTLLSSQQLLDCSTSYGNGDCNKGGEMTYAFDYVKDNGIEPASKYPYEGVQQSCRYTASETIVKVASYVELEKGNEDSLKDAVANKGPVSVGIDGDTIQLYLGGIFSSILCSHDLNHGVLVVGYGTEKVLFSNTDYWIVKNSWGSGWGEDGYMKVKRNAKSMCGIADEPVYPIIV